MIRSADRSSCFSLNNVRFSIVSKHSPRNKEVTILIGRRIGGMKVLDDNDVLYDVIPIEDNNSRKRIKYSDSIESIIDCFVKRYCLEDVKK
jgi:hypothetical protein